MGGTLTQFPLGFFGGRELFRAKELQLLTIVAVLFQCFAVQADTLSPDDESAGATDGTAGADLGTASTPPACVAVPAGAVAWWRAESNTVDSIGINDGLFQRVGIYVNGKVGSAFSFVLPIPTPPPGTVNYIAVPPSAELDLRQGAGL